MVVARNRARALHQQMSKALQPTRTVSQTLRRTFSRYHLVRVREAMRRNTLTVRVTVYHAHSRMIPLPVMKFSRMRKAKLRPCGLSESGNLSQYVLGLLVRKILAHVILDLA